MIYVRRIGFVFVKYPDYFTIFVYFGYVLAPVLFQLFYIAIKLRDAWYFKNGVHAFPKQSM